MGNTCGKSSTTALQPTLDRSINEDKDNKVAIKGYRRDEQVVVGRILTGNKRVQMAAINFSDLKLHKVIGTGAFGEVIKGTYCETPVVIKRMLRNKISEHSLRMFCDEIRRMMVLRHPNIIQFIGASWNSYSNICFVTEFLELGDLFSVLGNPLHNISWKNHILDMAIDTARGMAYLHSLDPPIIHRDLKSMNILVSGSYNCKVSDFGLSRELSLDETMSVTGTPLWLPPEMIKGEKYTEKADVYSFGIVLSEFDTRRIPYHDVKPKGNRKKYVAGTTLMHMVAYDNLRPSLSSNCLKGIKALFERCTDGSYENRPSFKEIVEELEGSIQEEVNTSMNAPDRLSDNDSRNLTARNLGIRVIDYIGDRDSEENVRSYAAAS